MSMSLTLLGDFSNPTRLVWVVLLVCGRPFGSDLLLLVWLFVSVTAPKRDVGKAVRMLLRGCCDAWDDDGCDICDEGKACLRLAEFPGLLMKTSVSKASCSRMFWCGEKSIGSRLGVLNMV